MTSLLSARGATIEGRLAPTGLEIGFGEMAALVGPNGGGKTSLLRALAGVEGSADRITIDGEALQGTPPARRPKLLGFLPASRDIAWPISARDVISLGGSPDESRVAELIERLELAPFASRPVNTLSTGERARVLLARALASRPKLLLLDEPLSNLDPYWVLGILALLRETVAAGACSAIVSVHDLAIAERFDTVMLMSNGRLQASGEPRALLGSDELSSAFRIERNDGEWRIRRPGGPQSLP
jgi:iron complex transport system ATP-binding protein